MKEIIREYQIVISAIIISLALIIYGVIQYNTSRYHFISDNSRSFVFDKVSGKAYHRGGRQIIDWIKNEKIDREKANQ